MDGTARSFAENALERAADLLNADKATGDDVDNAVAFAQASAILAVAEELGRLRSTIDLNAAAGAFLQRDPTS